MRSHLEEGKCRAGEKPGPDPPGPAFLKPPSQCLPLHCLGPLDLGFCHLRLKEKSETNPPPQGFPAGLPMPRPTTPVRSLYLKMTSAHVCHRRTTYRTHPPSMFPPLHVQPLEKTGVTVLYRCHLVTRRGSRSVKPPTSFTSSRDPAWGLAPTHCSERSRKLCIFSHTTAFPYPSQAKLGNKILPGDGEDFRMLMPFYGAFSISLSQVLLIPEGRKLNYHGQAWEAPSPRSAWAHTYFSPSVDTSLPR